VAFTNTRPHRVAWLVTGPRRPRPVCNARNRQISPTRFPEEAEFKTADKLAKARAKVRKLVTRKCTDALVGALDTCGDTVADLVSPDATSGCLIETHDAGVADLLTAQYGG